MVMQSHSFSLGAKPIELHGAANKKQQKVKLNSQVLGEEFTIDAHTWLHGAAKEYHISSDINDYILVPVPSLISDLPNTNGDSATVQELLRFVPDAGMLAYQTWRGKPTHIEHQNKDITKAKGVIFDVYLKRLTGYMGNHVTVIKLLGFDRSKDSLLCDAILKRKVNTYSLGMFYKTYECSVCGTQVSQNSGNMCTHTKPRRKTYMTANGHLAYRRCIGIVGFETSAVADPAYVSAASDFLLDPQAL